MPLVTPNQGELELLDKMLRDALVTNEDYVLKLYKNDYTPDDSSVEASFVEADFTNYVAVTLTRANWNPAVTNANGKAETSYGTSPISWTCGATGNTIYGYYVIGATSGVVLWAERFSVPRVMSNGNVLNLTPKFTLDKEP